ncbi:MAG: Nif3-like dinuclear metal center hexameric protein [Streptococcus hyovaginalis]|nr:Nif3-like dinuclear metal center hexameric protein [Streptococcus hyovaginalis]
MLAKDLIARYEAYCPPELSMDGDVVGLQIGTLDKPIQKVMVALDVRETTVAEAIDKQVDLIITKHAPIFKGIKDLVSSPQRDILLNLVKHDVAVYVSHTNIDIIPDGLNDWFCATLGITDTEPLSLTDDQLGIGRIGVIPEQSLKDFAAKVKESFDLDSVRLVRYDGANPTISKVAICGGSGQSFYPEALAKGADVYVTGDIYYHTAQEMLTEGLYALDPGHHIEVLFISEITKRLNQWKDEEGWQVDILESQSSTNPFSHV